MHIHLHLAVTDLILPQGNWKQTGEEGGLLPGNLTLIDANAAATNCLATTCIPYDGNLVSVQALHVFQHAST